MSSPLTPRATSFQDWFQTQRWFDWQNESAETCPALGMIQLKPFTIDDTEDPKSFFMDGSKPVWYGTVPNVYGQELQNPALLAFNGLGAVAPGKRGLATMHPLCLAATSSTTGNTGPGPINYFTDAFYRHKCKWVGTADGLSHNSSYISSPVKYAAATQGGPRSHAAQSVRARQQKDPNIILLHTTNRNEPYPALEMPSGSSVIGYGRWTGSEGRFGGISESDIDNRILPHFNNYGAQTREFDINNPQDSRGLWIRDGGIYYGTVRFDADILGSLVFVNYDRRVSSLAVTMTYDSGSGPADTPFAGRLANTEDEYYGDGVETRYNPRALEFPFLIQLQPNSWIDVRLDYTLESPDVRFPWDFALQMRWQSQTLPRYEDA
jgi:hypothetical protein